MVTEIARRKRKERKMMKLRKRSLLVVCSMLTTLILMFGPDLAAATNEVELVEPADTVYAAGWDNHLVYSILVIANVVYGASRLPTSKEVEIRGTVLAAEWGRYYEVIGVEILTTKNEEIAVSKSGKGMELLELDKHFIRAVGTIEIDKKGRKTITVVRYEILY